MKAFTFIIAALFSTAAQADFSRPVTTQNLNCVSQQKNGAGITLKIQARTGVTRITVRDSAAGATRDILNRSSLTVQSEGNVYIQQVSNDLGYNLFLTGPGLAEVLSRGETKTLTLRGTIDFFESEKQYALVCKGTLSAAVDAQAR